MAYLVLMTEGQNGPRFSLDKMSLSIGRSPECDIHLDDPSVSFEHAELMLADHNTDEVWINDVNSTNGTFVNNRKVNKAMLKNNDNINIGLSNFRFHNDDDAVLEHTQQIKKSWIPGVFYLKDRS